MSEKQQRLVLSIIEFLNQSIADGTVKQDDREGLEVAVQCIGEAFGVDPNDEAQVGRLSIKPASLTSLFDLFMKTRERMSGGAPSTSTPSPQASSSKVDKEAAEKEKEKGNKFVSAKKYNEAIEAYGRAIALNPSNAVYYSNRAAAHSFNNDHPSAIIDAQKALEVDSKFVKAYNRLGHAHYSLGDYSEAAHAFRRGLEVDPGNANLKSSLQNAESRLESSSSTAEPAVPDRAAGAPGLGGGGGLGGLANMFGGGGGGGGGMPDLASIMNNPMLMQMAQNMMANGGMEELMRNPALQNMASRMQSGNTPSMEEMMSDPTIRNLASKFGAGGAGGGGV